MRPDFERGLQVIGADLLVPFELDLLDHRPLDHLKRQRVLSVDVVDRGLNVLEKSHGIDRTDVLLDDRRVRRLADLASHPDPDRALLDSGVADDANDFDVRSLGDGDRAEGQHPKQQDRAEASHLHEIRASYQMVVGVYSTTAAAVGRGRTPAVHAEVTPTAVSSRPSCKRMTRSMAAASRGLWVTTTSATPRSPLSSMMRRCTSSPVPGSRFPVGSSASSTRGESTTARATETRCCSPPESSPGLCSSRSDKPTRARMSRASRLARS